MRTSAAPRNDPPVGNKVKRSRGRSTRSGTVIRPIPLRYTEEALPASVGFLMSLLLAIFLQKKVGVSRTAGGVLLLAYLAYLGHSIANA